MNTMINSIIIAWVTILSSPCIGQGNVDHPVLQDSIGHLNTVCGNYGEQLPVDTLNGPWPYQSLKTTSSELSPDGRYIATKLSTDPPYILVEGLAIYDRLERRVIEFFPGANFPHWSPDGTMLVCTDFIYDFLNRKEIPFPSAPTVIGGPIWSVDGEHIYYNAGGQGPGMYRSSKHGRNLEPIESRYRSKPISLDEMVHFRSSMRGEPKGYTIINITTKAEYFVNVPAFFDVDNIRTVSVSKNKRFVAMDVNYFPGDRFNGNQALCMLDLQTQRVKKLLPGQAFANLYYPSWSSDSTLLISFVCRLDSSCTTWEIDTNGVFLRQLLSKDILNVPTSITPLYQIPSGFSISSFFPHPGNGLGMLEYDVEKAGAYSLSIISVSGKEVRGILKETWHKPGRHQASVRTDDLPAGMYLIRLSNSRNQPVYHKLLLE